MNTNTPNHSYQGDDVLNESGGHQSQAYGYSSKLAYLRRPCLIVAKGIRWLPVFFITSIVVWSYYAYVVQLNLTYVDTIFEKVIFLTFFHIIFLMFVWSYYKIVFTVPATVPSSWILSTAMLEQLTAAKTEDEWKGLLELFIVEMQLPVAQRSIQGAVRYCEKCTQVKPDRSHHCGVCEKCILKMDHHCPWVNNCVAFNNYKFFILFLGYALLFCIWVAVTSFKYFIRFWTGELPDDSGGKYHILFLFFVSVMFSISISSLFWYHIYLTLQNRSTLEQFRAPVFRSGPDEKGWSLGKTNNFQEVFGDRKLLWFVPVETHLGDGLLFPTRLQPEGPIGVNGIGGPYRTLSDASTSRIPPTDSYSVDLIDEANHLPEKVATEIVMDGLNSHKVRLARDPDTLTGVSVQ